MVVHLSLSHSVQGPDIEALEIWAWVPYCALSLSKKVLPLGNPPGMGYHQEPGSDDQVPKHIFLLEKAITKTKLIFNMQFSNQPQG